MNALNARSLQIRTLSAVILGPFVIFCTLYAQWTFVAMVFVAFGLSIYEMVSLFHKEKGALAPTLYGIAYVVFCFACFITLYFMVHQGAMLALSLMFCVWACDIGAYFAGKIIGGPKMAPSISPKKTWAGLAGGVVFSMVTMVGFILFAPDFPIESILLGMGIGIVLGGIAQLGDLYMSMQKRKVGAKDMGDIIPGHGGLLDRIDSLLLASPIFLIILWGLGL